MSAIHLDHADEEQLLGLTGVGGTSATKILNFLKVHKTFTKFQQLQECAPQIVKEAFENAHRIGTWISEIEEFRHIRPADLNVSVPNQSQAENQDQNKEEGASGGAELDNPKTENLEQPKDDSSALLTFIARWEKSQARMEATQTRIEGRLALLDEHERRMGALENSMESLKLEVRTGHVIAQHNNNKWNPGSDSTKSFSFSSFATPNKPPNVKNPPKHSDVKSQVPKTDATTIPELRSSESKVDGYGGARSKVPPHKPAKHSDDNNCMEGGEDNDTNSMTTRRLIKRPEGPDIRLGKVVDKFNGSVGTWENWFHKFQLTARLCKWNDTDKLFWLTTSLTGPALTAHRNLPEEATLDYDALAEALAERFGKTDSATQAILRAELRDIKQKEGEDLEAFADRVYSQCIDAHPPETSPGQLHLYAVEAFMGGIADKNSAWLASNVANPKTVFEAVNQVKLAQLTSKRLGMKFAVRCTSSTDDHVSEPKQVHFDPEVKRMDTGESRCFRCGGKWHLARDCPSQRCEVCDGTGHDSSNCPVKNKPRTRGNYSNIPRSTNRDYTPPRSFGRQNRREDSVEKQRRDRKREGRRSRRRYSTSESSSSGSNSPVKEDRRSSRNKDRSGKDKSRGQHQKDDRTTKKQHQVREVNIATEDSSSDDLN